MGTFLRSFRWQATLAEAGHMLLLGRRWAKPRFPPNSGDLKPIVTVWARLRHDLSTREREDLKEGRALSTGQFKLRVSQLLTSYSERKAGERFNYYERLLRGMPARLAKCRANKFGPCGK